MREGLSLLCPGRLQEGLFSLDFYFVIVSELDPSVVFIFKFGCCYAF
jgi:hypothetical protein